MVSDFQWAVGRALYARTRETTRSRDSRRISAGLACRYKTRIGQRAVKFCGSKPRRAWAGDCEEYPWCCLRLMRGCLSRDDEKNTVLFFG